MFIYVFCVEADHKNHNDVPLEKESEEKKAIMIQETIAKIQDIKHSAEFLFSPVIDWCIPVQRSTHQELVWDQYEHWCECGHWGELGTQLQETLDRNLKHTAMYISCITFTFSFTF